MGWYSLHKATQAKRLSRAATLKRMQHARSEAATICSKYHLQSSSAVQTCETDAALSSVEVSHCTAKTGFSKKTVCIGEHAIRRFMFLFFICCLWHVCLSWVLAVNVLGTSAVRVSESRISRIDTETRTDIESCIGSTDTEFNKKSMKPLEQDYVLRQTATS